MAIGARSGEQLKLAVSQLEEVTGTGRITATSVDVTDAEAARAWVTEVVDEFGGLHVMLVSGGSPPMGRASRFELTDYQAAVTQTLFPAIGLALAAVPHMRAAGWGRLLFMASETAVHPVSIAGVVRRRPERLGPLRPGTGRRRRSERHHGQCDRPRHRAHPTADASRGSAGRPRRNR